MPNQAKQNSTKRIYKKYHEFACLGQQLLDTPLVLFNIPSKTPLERADFLCQWVSFADSSWLVEGAHVSILLSVLEPHPELTHAGLVMLLLSVSSNMHQSCCI